jgi:hypothetical protein
MLLSQIRTINSSEGIIFASFLPRRFAEFRETAEWRKKEESRSLVALRQMQMQMQMQNLRVPRERLRELDASQCQRVKNIRPV